MKQITLKTIYEKASMLQRDVAEIKKSLFEEPELQEHFIRPLHAVELEKSIPVKAFGKRYGLKFWKKTCNPPRFQSS